MIRTILARLATDTDTLRARIAELESELASVTWMRDHHKAEAEALHRMHANAVDERDRLRVLAGNTAATSHESLMLGLVRDTPGLLAREYGAAFAKIDPEYPSDDPNHWIVGNNAKHLTSLYKKGLVRRVPVGQTYRYWVTE